MVNCIKEREGSGLKPPNYKENQKGRLTKDTNPHQGTFQKMDTEQRRKKMEKRNLWEDWFCNLLHFEAARDHKRATGFKDTHSKQASALQAMRENQKEAELCPAYWWAHQNTIRQGNMILMAPKHYKDRCTSIAGHCLQQNRAMQRNTTQLCKTELHLWLEEKKKLKRSLPAWKDCRKTQSELEKNKEASAAPHQPHWIAARLSKEQQPNSPTQLIIPKNWTKRRLEVQPKLAEAPLLLWRPERSTTGPPLVVFVHLNFCFIWSVGN